jgi:aspartate/tyrosine/aromatic aminotransferase
LLKLASSAGVKKVLLPTPTWPNHLKVCSTVGIHITETPYLADSLPCIDSIIEEVAALTQPHVLLMQAGCHNPTGLDPSQDQWKALAKSLKGTSHILLLDFPYQGLGKGVQEDAEVIQICMDAGISFLIAWSASKNHGIYGLRTGVAFAVVSDSETEVIQQHLDMISRSTISVAPVTGQYALSITQSKFKKEWLDELAELRLSLDKKREVISKMLPTLSCINTNGLFIKLPLSADQIDSLKSKNIFLNPNGRLNIAGIPAERIEELCKAIAEVL